MSASPVQARTKAGRLNKLAVAAIVLAAIAALGFWVLGAAVLAVFAVGAGHVSLHQILLRGERGRGLAIAALAIGYAMATLAVFTTLSYIPGAVRQFMM